MTGVTTMLRSEKEMTELEAEVERLKALHRSAQIEANEANSRAISIAEKLYAAKIAVADAASAERGWLAGVTTGTLKGSRHPRACFMGHVVQWGEVRTVFAPLKKDGTPGARTFTVWGAPEFTPDLAP
jgi:hypothetical protein